MLLDGHNFRSQRFCAPDYAIYESKMGISQGWQAYAANAAVSQSGRVIHQLNFGLKSLHEHRSLEL